MCKLDTVRIVKTLLCYLGKHVENMWEETEVLD